MELEIISAKEAKVELDGVELVVRYSLEPFRKAKSGHPDTREAAEGGCIIESAWVNGEKIKLTLHQQLAIEEALTDEISCDGEISSSYKLLFLKK